MSQSRIHSFVEAWTGTVIGFVVSMALSVFVFHLFGHAFTMGQNFMIVSMFTVASVIRGYAVRRFFNWLHVVRMERT